MSDQLVRDIEILTELFKAGGWSELRIEGDGLSLLLSNDRAAPALGEAVSVPAAVAGPAPRAAAPSALSRVEVPAGSPATSDDIDPSWVAVTAPNLGTFYRSPKPGAAPFIEVGQRVEPGTEVCLIEVMKLFTSVRAEVGGTVRHIAVADAELVEGGRALIYIERD